jgi:ABC-type transport system involved in multi-copper enzyme maturation permease subunit
MKGAVSAIMKKDIQQVFSSKQTLAPMLIVPLVFSVFLPLMMILTGSASMGSVTNGANVDDLSMYLTMLAGSGDILAKVQSFSSPDMQFLFLFLNYLFMPMFVLIPVMISSIISANSVVGEKEKHTLETLLYAPVSMPRMFWGKVLAAFVPAIVITYISVAIYGCVVNFGTHSLFGDFIFPTTNWYVFLFVLTPAFSMLATILMVFVSAKAKTFQAAQQWSVIIVLPVIGLMMVQTSGVMFISQQILALIGVIVMAVDVVLVFQGLGRFTRQKLID